MKKILLFILFFIGNLSFSQWNNNTATNTLVSNVDSNDIKSILTSDGKTYVVFWKAVTSPVNYELRVQVLDQQGNQLLGNEGALISNTIPMLGFTSFWSINIDSNDNLFVGATGTNGNVGFAYKINTSGTVLWSVSNPSALLVKVLPLSNGEVIVAWLNESTVSVNMQKYTSNGNSIWPSTQTFSAPTAPADLYEISSGNFIMVYHQIGTGVNSTLFAQRFDSNGNASWATPTQLSNKTTAYNVIYDGTKDGDVVYFSYSGKTGTRFDSFLQRINSDGTLPWGINGVDFDTNATNYEMQTEVAFTSGSNYIWSICTYRNSAQTEVGEFVQKFDKLTGARQFSNNAKQVFAIGTNMLHAGNLELVNDQPLFLLINGVNNGASPISLLACFLDNNGDFVWNTQTKPMATFSAAKSRVQFVKPNNGQAITVFVENKGNGDKIYAQNLVDSSLSVDVFYPELKVYIINPVKNELFISSETDINSISVYNSLGQLILNNKVISNEISLDAHSWRTGIYFVNLTLKNGLVKYIKIVKE